MAGQSDSRKYQQKYNASEKGLKRRADYRRRHKIELRFYYRAYHRSQRRSDIETKLKQLQTRLARPIQDGSKSLLELQVEKLKAKLELIELAEREDTVRQRARQN